MFDIERVDNQTIRLSGRLDAARAPEAERVLEGVEGSCTVDCEELTYISSAGLGVLVALRMRLAEDDEQLRVVNLNAHLRELFELTGLDTVIQID